MTKISLNTLATAPGSRKAAKRKGRGGKFHKTSGRGGKGQTARRGVAIDGFEGGQTPLHMRLPKRGFNNFTRKEFDIISIDDLLRINEKYSLNNNIKITDLRNIGYGKKKGVKIKILSNGCDNLKIGLKVEAHAVSKKAKETIDSLSGSVTLVA